MKKKILLSLILPIVLLFPKSGFAQVPPLGATNNFAIFTAVGAISNVGTATGTEVWGDVGTHVGSFTAFPPGILHGVIHVADPVSALAAASVSTLYGNLFGRICGTVLTGTLGGGTILGPGIYCKGDATTLNGELILDAGGNSNALFIFQIGGDFSTGSSAVITLINSASLCNVFWQINGEFTLGDGTIFRGTVVVNGAIHLLEGSSLFGRALSTSGSVDMHNNPVIDVSGCGTLPVSLSLFTARRTDQSNVALRWETVTEINNMGFFVERSIGNGSWETVSFVPTQAPGGNSSTLFTYFLNDLNSHKGITQYRLKQVDIDGLAKLSQIRAVRGATQKAGIIIYPNPSTDGRVSIVFEHSEGLRDVSLTDINGRIVKEWKGVANNTLHIAIPGKGLFFFRVTIQESGIQRIQKIVVN